ncbi:hypothetical protein D3C73_1266100 [compost metagenome]
MNRAVEHILFVIVYPQFFEAHKQIIGESGIILGKLRQCFKGTDYVIAEEAYASAMKRRQAGVYSTWCSIWLHPALQHIQRLALQFTACQISRL